MPKWMPNSQAPSDRLWPSSAELVPAAQRGYLDQIAAGVIGFGDGRASDFGRLHGEVGAQRLHAVVFPLHVVYVEHGRRLALLEHRLLVSLRGRIVVERQLQLGAIGLLG